MLRHTLHFACLMSWQAPQSQQGLIAKECRREDFIHVRKCGCSCPGTYRYGFTRQLKKSCYQALCNLRGNLAAGCIRLALESFLIYRASFCGHEIAQVEVQVAIVFQSVHHTHITGCNGGS